MVYKQGSYKILLSWSLESEFRRFCGLWGTPIVSVPCSRLFAEQGQWLNGEISRVRTERVRILVSVQEALSAELPPMTP